MGIRTMCLDPDDEELPYIKIRTLPAKFQGTGVITCTKLWEIQTHYVGYRTLPCLEPDCPQCDSMAPKRYEAFLSVVWTRGRDHEIIRCTQGFVYQLKSQARNIEDLRGMRIEVNRATERRNGRLCCKVLDGWSEGARLPERPDVEAHLMRAFRIDGIRVSDNEREYIIRLIKHAEEAKQKRESKNATGSS